MSDFEIKQNIQSVLKSFPEANLTEKSLNLFKSLGYNTKRQAPLDKKTYKGFKDAYLDGNTRFNEEKAVVSEWQYIDLLFQLSKDEITTQIGLFDTKRVDRTIIETYLFFVIELSKESYSRSVLSHIAREMNKVFPMPVMVLFKHGEALTLAVINRRLHKKDEQKDVLEKVTLIKDINVESPHRAHIEILFDLSLEELQQEHKFTNFVELHNAWQKTLDTKELNKKFYRELSNWYFRAMKEVDFPSDELHRDKKSLFKEEDKEKEHNAKNLIRLLTRFLFVWFVKEKGLIPEEIFDEKYVANELLLNFRPKKGTGASGNITSCYYRAILQNLFFATLNQNMGKREFRKSGQHMNVTNLMRYERYFKDSKKFVQLVEKIVPFMNGGLFECLDRPDLEKKGKQGGDLIIYLDGFSDREDNHLTIPDYIFFGTEGHVDLSDAYGDKAKEYKNAAVKGLINILKSYKFTVAENTPLEEEIALDPELLGQVFENLLASYNPETKTTARKQTGSFYTPREIVNYMVDESLIAYLKQKLEDAGISDKEDNLRDLISYSENPNLFNTKETQQLISAIDVCKILDPACGSGAFPMGILHKLVHILHKLDPKNALWKQRQIAKARAIDDSALRDQSIADIEEAFDNNELDYGRKLYLIENCIYGVDIQPIATQISKLRFFISLIVDQKVNLKKDNFGIRPLPNLETKFVAANTLIGIEKPKAQMDFGTDGIKAIEESLKDVRHRLFSAKTPATKRKLREEDKDIREQMGVLLVKNGWKNETAKQLASWDPYDQNASSLFFNTEWMFGLTEGFDVVIGNPPYGADLSTDEINYFKKSYKIKTSETAILFIEKGYNLIKKDGIESYIIPKSYTFSSNYSACRSLTKNELYFIVDCGKAFEQVKLEACVFHLQKSAFRNSYNSYKYSDNGSFSLLSNIDKNLIDIFGFFPNGINQDEISLGLKILGNKKTLQDITKNSRGEFLQEHITTQGDYKTIGGKEINKFGIRGIKGQIKKEHVFSNKGFIQPNSILTQNIVAHIMNPTDHIKITACIPNSTEYLITDTINQITITDSKYSTSYIWALLNSKLINWYCYYFIFGKAIRTMHFDNTVTDRIPVREIKESITVIFNKIVCLSHLAYKYSLTPQVIFFDRIINSIVYEIYLSNEVKTAGCEVLKYLKNLLEFKEDCNDEMKFVAIEKSYKELSDLKHPLSIAMIKMQEVPEVRIIEGRDRGILV